MKQPESHGLGRARTALFLLLALFVGVCILPGCGGYSQNDIRKYAIKRPSDDEDAAAPRPPVAARSSPPAASAGNPTVAPAPTAAPPAKSQPAPAAKPADPGPTTSPSASAQPSTLSDTRQFEPSWTETQRRQMTLEHLQRIGQALEAYLAEKGTYPLQACYSPGGRPLFSWRVELLPYLGYEQLHQQFRRDEPWDSPHNQALLSAIPSVYQSPERCDTKTNYLVAVGSPTAFPGRQARPPRRWEDRAENTLLVLEVDDDLAVPWTQPEDLQFNSANPWQGLQKLREDGCFAVFGGGRVARIPRGLDGRVLRGLFTVDGGESVLAGAVTEPAKAELAGGAATASLGSSASLIDAANPSLSLDHAGGESRRSLPATAGAGSELSSRARSAAEVGRESDAIRFCHAAYLTGEAGTGAWFQWIPALRRPAISVRIGVGLDYVGTERKQLDRLAKTNQTPTEWSQHRAALEPIVGELGAPILDVLESAPRLLPPPLVIATPATRTRSMPGAGLTFLGVADQRTLELVARRELVDCLVLFVVEQRNPRRAQNYDVASVRVVDVFARRLLYESPRISYLRREQSLRDPLFDDPLPVVLTELEKLVAQQLQPVAVPPQLQPEHAARRVQQLSRITGDLQLVALSEMCFYQRSDLVSLQELLAALQTATGQDAGLTLLAGTPQAKHEVIADWLPHQRLTATALTRGRSDPDDD